MNDRSPSVARPVLVVAHPSPDLYGSDRMLLESVRALSDEWHVVVALPTDGPLVPELRLLGIEVVFHSTPVLRKALLNPLGMAALLAALITRLPGTVRLLRRRRANVVYVNTLTVPWWIAAARLAGARTVCHVHEAEQELPRLLSLALSAPLVACHAVLVNSEASAGVVRGSVPGLLRRTVVIYNGVPGPPEPATLRESLGPVARLVVVGRLSPRKGSDVAVEALRLLQQEGRRVRLDLVGSVFPGYEWFESNLRTHGADLVAQGVLRFCGFRSPVWPVLEDADIVLVPSRQEPFGNVAVEGMLACRPVVASGVQGLTEIVVPGVTGLLVPPGDAALLAGAVAGLLDDWPSARRMAAAGRQRALDRFSPQRYAHELREQLGRHTPDRVAATRERHRTAARGLLWREQRREGRPSGR